jgi:AcrR family transcriptional regulator
MAQPLDQVDATPPLGRRERKKLATRTAVRDAALSLAARHGVENVTVEQITAEADIALRTFFNHFSSKEEAVVAAVADGAEALVAEFRTRPPGESVLQAIREAVLVVMSRNDTANRDHIQALRLIRDSPALLSQQMVVLTTQEKALADAIAERIGVTARSAYPALCAAAALAVLRVVLDRWLVHTTERGDAPSLDVLREEIDEAISCLASGLDRPAPKRPREPEPTRPSGS